MSPIRMPRARIVVADDDAQIVSLVSDVLTREGYEVLTASNGMNAAILCETMKPDLVLSDVEMPALDGFGLAKRIALMPFQVPLILMSGESHAAGELAAMSAPEEFVFLRKPFTPAELRALVSKLCGGIAADASS